MVVWSIACAGYAAYSMWRHSDAPMLSLWFVLQAWFYGIVPLGVLSLVFAPAQTEPTAAEARRAGDRVRDLLSHRRARARRNAVVLWVVATIAVAGAAFVVKDQIARHPNGIGNPAAPGAPNSGLPVFENLRDEWKMLSDNWQAQQKAASAASATGSYWTSRDDDAYRIMQSVASHLESLRRAEARQDSTDWALQLLRGDRREWEALVLGVAPEMPARGSGR